MAAVHAYDPRFFICCGIDECTRTYQNFFSFKKHAYRKHRGSLEKGHEENSVMERVGSEGDSASELMNEDVVDLGDEPDTLTEFQRIRMKRIALFLLRAKEVRKVSQTALNGLLEDFSNIVQEIVSQIKSEVNACLSSRGLSLEVFDGLEDVFSNRNNLEPFRGLDSKYLQEAFYREHFHLLVG